MKYEILHIDQKDLLLLGITNLNDETTYNHYVNLASGLMGKFSVAFTPNNKNYVEGNYIFDPSEDRFLKHIEGDSSILYFFIKNSSKINYIDFNEWFDSARTKGLTDKLNMERIKKLAGL